VLPLGLPKLIRKSNGCPIDKPCAVLYCSGNRVGLGDDEMEWELVLMWTVVVLLAVFCLGVSVLFWFLPVQGAGVARCILGVLISLGGIVGAAGFISSALIVMEDYDS